MLALVTLRLLFSNIINMQILHWQTTYEPGSKVCFDDCQDHNCGEMCSCTHTVKFEKLDKAVQMVFVNNGNFYMINGI